MDCEKKAFKTREEAEQRLQEIISESLEDTVPFRVYECEYCDYFHLTSKTEKDYKKNKLKRRKQIAKINERREKTFINRESRYWNKRFGIE